MTEEEYLALINSVIEDDSQLHDEIRENLIWNTSEAALEKMAIAQANKTGPVIDITSYSRQKIEDDFDKLTNFTYGKFLIRVRKPFTLPYFKKSNPNNYELTIMEHQTKTPAGNSCNIYTMVRLDSDSRFKHLSKMIKRFYSKQEVIDVLKQIQAALKMSAFV